MGMWNNGLSGTHALVRSLLLTSGFVGILWSAVALPAFWRTIPSSDAATRIIANDRFKPGGLQDVLVRIDAEAASVLSKPELVRAKALVQLRLAEEAMSRNSSEEADRRVSLALKDIRVALTLSPGDSFLWLMLYSVETARSGFEAQYIRFLQQSYSTGPHEGWVSLRRNRMALGAFPILSTPLRSAVVSEFEEMVDSDFIEDAALNLEGVGWQYREQLLAALSLADVLSRQSLHKRLVADGVKLAIPGIAIDERPWR